MRRGLTYAFRVEGGDDPYDPDFYNPFVISTDPVGGFDRLSNEKNYPRVRVLAGLEYTRRGAPRTTASGISSMRSLGTYISLPLIMMVIFRTTLHMESS